MSNYTILDPEGTFKNKGYKEWVQDWSNWFYQPNPDQNNNGDIVFLRSISFHEGVFKKGPNVMIGKDALVISENQRLLMPIITANSVPYNTERPEVMYGFVRSHIANGDSPPALEQIRIDCESLRADCLRGGNLGLYEIETPIFQLAIPDDSEGPSLKNYGEYQVPSSGFFQSVTRGFFIILELKAKDDQQSYYIECSTSGATTDRGKYNASMFYEIIVNKVGTESIPESLQPKKTVLHNEPNRNIQLIIDQKYANNEINDDEYLKIMDKLRVPLPAQRFAKRAREKLSNNISDQGHTEEANR